VTLRRREHHLLQPAAAKPSTFSMMVTTCLHLCGCTTVADSCAAGGQLTSTAASAAAHMRASSWPCSAAADWGATAGRPLKPAEGKSASIDMLQNLTDCKRQHACLHASAWLSWQYRWSTLTWQHTEGQQPPPPLLMVPWLRQLRTGRRCTQGSCRGTSFHNGLSRRIQSLLRCCFRCCGLCLLLRPGLCFHCRPVINWRHRARRSLQGVPNILLLPWCQGPEAALVLGFPMRQCTAGICHTLLSSARLGDQ
jgi:hypothetical protein